MYAPITSEINIEPGMLLREIATDQLFSVEGRLRSTLEVTGEDIWRIIPVDNISREPVVMSRQELSEKYFVEVDERGD
jgi:hypothetical protein